MSTEVRRLPTLAPARHDSDFVLRPMDERLRSDTRWESHSHEYGELAWNETGASSATIGARRFTITPTMGLWIPAGVVHAAHAPAGTWFRAVHVASSGAQMPQGPVGVEISDLLRLLLIRLDEDLTDRSRSVTEAMVLDLLGPATRHTELRLPVTPLLRPIVDALTDDPSDSRGASEWAARLGVSTRTVTRAFERDTGMTFARWSTRVKAERALHLIAAGEDLEDVAEAVGYRSVSAFGAAFKRSTGTTPGSHRPARPHL